MQPEKRFRLQPIVGGLGLAVVAALVAGFFLGQSMDQDDSAEKVAPLEQEVLALKAEGTLLRAMLGQVEAKVALLGPLVSGGKGHGKVAWDEAQQVGFLYVGQLRPAPAGKTYQLSIGRSGKPLTRCLVFEPEPNGDVKQRFSPESRAFGVDTFCISVEDAGGAKTPSGEVVLQGSL
jgi:hypothetical protein